MIVLTSALSAVTGTVVGAVFGMIVGVLKKHKSKDKAVEKAVSALAHDALFRYCRLIIKEQYTTTETLDNLELLYSSYKSLGLNGTGEKLYQQCKGLPLRMENE